MLDYFIVPGLLAVPVLIYKVKTYRRGLVTGLFISLFFLYKINPLLALVSLGPALYLFFTTREKKTDQKDALYILNPSLPMLILFMLAMIIFCAFSDAFYRYGTYLMLDNKALEISQQLTFAACAIGPVIIGSRCDRKGPFGTAVFLTLLSELSVLLASAGGSALLLYVAGSLLVQLCISGFFVLMPIIASAFFGEENFLRFYPYMIAVSWLFWCIARYQYLHQWRDTANPGGFLMNLVLLTFIAACFIYAAWRRRFVLVAPAH